MSMLAWAFTIAIGAAGGALLRHGSYLWIERRYAGVFPVATLFVNLLGSLLMGLIVGLAASGALSPFWLKLLAAGGCGSLTTFSSFAADWMRLNRAGRPGLGLSYVGLTLVAGMALAAGGLVLARAIV